MNQPSRPGPLARILAPFTDGWRRIEAAERFAHLDNDDVMAIADAVQVDEPIPYGITAFADQLAELQRSVGDLMGLCDLFLWEMDQ